MTERWKPILLASCCLLALITHAAAPERAKPDSATTAKVKDAIAVLDTWRADTPRTANRKLHVIYWTPSDREPAPRYRERLSAIMQNISAFYGSEMERLGFGRLAPALHLADDGLLAIHVVKSQLPYEKFDVKSGHAIRDEARPVLKAEGIDIDKETVLIFANMSNWDPEKRTISQNSPYYASGSHQAGVAWQVDSPILDIDSIADKGNHVHDGQYRHISLGRYNSIFIGGIAHELGHALGLPHVRELPSDKKVYGTALMGSGNRTYGEELRGESQGSFLTLAHGLRLASHPLFCGIMKDARQRSSAKLENVDIKTEPGSVQLSGRINAAVPCYTVLGYWDPEEGQDYDSQSYAAIPDSTGTFTLDIAEFPAKNKGELRIVPLFVNGSASSFSSGGNNPFKYTFTLDHQRVATVK